MWKVIDTGVNTAAWNMAKDAELLEGLGDEPILHLYDWTRPSATYGYFMKVGEFVQPGHGVDLARRPTGGGMVFHTHDLAFSVLVPASHEGFSDNTMECYKFVNDAVARAVKGGGLLPEEPIPLDEASRNFCMAKPTKYDVMIDGRKVAGAAQRKKKQGFLHQGTISLALPPKDFLESVLLPGTKVIEAMSQNTYALLGKKASSTEIFEAREELKAQLVKEICQRKQL